MDYGFLTHPAEAEFWVLVALLLFVGLLFFFKVPRAAAKALDARTAAVQSELDEAARLHKQAETLLASIHAQRLEAERHAAEMMANAEAEAKRYEVEAKARLEESLKRRQQLAERRIANAEAQASAEVKAAAADLAAQLAEGVLSHRLAGSTTDPLIDQATRQLGARLS